jgi:hypothetical protein
VPETLKQGGEVRSHGARGSTEALLNREVGFGTVGHVAAPEPSRAGRRDLVPWDTWQCRRSLEQGGGIWSCRACGSTSCSLS